MIEHINQYTFTGRVSFPKGAPNITDIAISLCREGRYVGAGVRWYPVGLHTFVVCDMLPPALKIHGLLHDSPECITGDVPTPLKTPAIRALEEKLLVEIYRAFGLKLPTLAEHKQIKKADRDALCGEIYTVGTAALQSEYERCPKAEKLTMKYVDDFSFAECLCPDGRAPMEFVRRFRVYSDLLTKSRHAGTSRKA